MEELLRRARAHKMTKAEYARQRRGWILAEAAMGSDADERAYRKALFTNDEEELARLKAEQEVRRERAAKILDEYQF